MTAQANETQTRSVVDGIIQRLSVSQLKKHKLCPRAWFFQKVMHFPEPSTGAQKIGTDGHAQVEHYISTGENVLGVQAIAGIHLLPTPGPDLMVEQALEGDPPLTAGGVPFAGFIDLVNPRRLLTEGVLRVTDHKFTSSVANNAATPDQLASADSEPGLQMIGYGTWALRQTKRFPGIRTLELEHIYYQTRGQRLAESVLVSVPVEHVEREWTSKVEPQVERMKAHARASSAFDVPANFGPACSKYGGCPHMAKCLSGGNKTVSLMNRLLKPNPAPESASPVERNAPEQLGQCPDCREQLNPENSSRLVSGGVRHVKCPKAPPAVLPPDAPPPESSTPTPSRPIPPAPLAAGVAEQPAPKRRGRPPKVRQEAPTSPQEPARTAEPARNATSPQEPARSPQEPAREATSPTSPQEPASGSQDPTPRLRSDLRVLFVDCIPITFDGPPPQPLTAYVDELHRQVADAGGVDDVRFAGGDSPLGFGKWRGALAMAARGELPAPGVYVVLGLAHSELMQVVVEALEPVFDVVIRGVR